MLRMQDSDGGVYHKCTSCNWFLECRTTSRRRLINLKTTHDTAFCPPATSSRVFTALHPDAAIGQRYLAAAEAAWDFLMAHPGNALGEGVPAGGYGTPTLARTRTTTTTTIGCGRPPSCTERPANTSMPTSSRLGTIPGATRAVVQQRRRQEHAALCNGGARRRADGRPVDGVDRARERGGLGGAAGTYCALHRPSRSQRVTESTCRDGLGGASSPWIAGGDHAAQGMAAHWRAAVPRYGAPGPRATVWSAPAIDELRYRPRTPSEELT